MMTATWDQSRFDAAIRERVNYGKRTVPQIVVTSAYWVALNTKAFMPFVPISRIDAELNARLSPGLLKSGKPSKAKKRAGEIVTVSAGGTVARNREVALAVLIVQASARAGSRYNALTGGRWARVSSPWKGKTRAAGARDMAATIARMIKSRHSTPHFLKTGWFPAIRTLLSSPFIVNQYRRGAASPSDDRGADRGGQDKGWATITGSDWATEVTIANAIGTRGANAKSQNEALWRHGAPALQRALDLEAAGMEQYVADHMAPGDRAFNAACA